MDFQLVSLINSFIVGRLYYDKADVVILVLSSREHYNERQAIRDTWMNTNQSIKYVTLIDILCLT